MSINLKQEAAKKAVGFISNQVTIGLGAGATMAYMVEYLQALQLPVQVYTSSADTNTLLQQHGFAINEVAGIASLDIYFDGCDQFDKDLNALKSGGGIHTAEKLLAAMAKEFVLVGDESKYSEHLTTKYPLVLEVLPEAARFVTATIQQAFKEVTDVSIRQSADHNRIITAHGNLLADVWFDTLPDLSQLNPTLKSIPGVVETSLFYNMAHKAIIAGTAGVKILEKNMY